MSFASLIAHKEGRNYEHELETVREHVGLRHDHASTTGTTRVVAVAATRPSMPVAMCCDASRPSSAAWGYLGMCCGTTLVEFGRTYGRRPSSALIAFGCSGTTPVSGMPPDGMV